MVARMALERRWCLDCMKWQPTVNCPFCGNQEACMGCYWCDTCCKEKK